MHTTIHLHDMVLSSAQVLGLYYALSYFSHFDVIFCINQSLLTLGQ